MDTIINIILPVFGLVALGFGLGRPPMFPGDFARSLSNFIFYLALPALLFRSMAARGFPQPAEWGLIAAYYLALSSVAIAALAYARFVYGESIGGAATLMLGAGFSNMVLIGVPLTLSAYGQEGLSQMLLLTTFHAAFLVGSATVLSEAGRAGRGGGLWCVAGKTMLALIQNPVIVAILSGALLGSLGGRIPTPIDNIIKMLGEAAVPCSLFALGASLVGLKLTDLVGRTLLMVLIKLLVLPVLVFLSAYYLFELPPLPLAVAVTTASLPIGMNVFLFAQRYQSHVARVSSATLLTTLLSALTTGLIIDFFRNTQ